MLNQVVLVGRVTELPNYNGRGILKVGRTQKDDNGIYQDDLIPFILKGSILENTLSYISLDDMLGIKGSLRMNEYDGLNIEVEKVTFLSSGSRN